MRYHYDINNINMNASKKTFNYLKIFALSVLFLFLILIGWCIRLFIVGVWCGLTFWFLGIFKFAVSALSLYF